MDITSGNNDYKNPNNPKAGIVPGYSAGPGYDLVTGWGSIDANAFVTAYLNAPSPSPMPTPAAQSKLQASPASLRFAITSVGAASKPKKLTLINASKNGKAAITLTQFNMTPNLESAPGGTCEVSQMLASKQKCTLCLQ
jgi:hypothetical protein